MSTNKDYSNYVRLRQAQVTSAYNQQVSYDITNGIIKIPTGGGSANRSSSSATNAVVGSVFFRNPALATPPTPPTPPAPPPYVGTAQYRYFYGGDSWDWGCPLDIVGPITYWLVGGGGGGGGAYNYGGSGGGGGGEVVTGTCAVTPGMHYTIVVGDGGDGGQGSTAGAFTPSSTGTTFEYAGMPGGDTIFGADLSGGGMACALGGGGGGYSRSQQYPNTGGYYKGGTAAGVNIPSTGGNGGGGGGGGGAGGGSSGAGGNGGNNVPAPAGGAGTVLSFPGVNGGAPVTYGVGGPGSRSVAFGNGVAGTYDTGNGGGGAFSQSGNQATGGKGGRGFAVIEYYI